MLDLSLGRTYSTLNYSFTFLLFYSKESLCIVYKRDYMKFAPWKMVNHCQVIKVFVGS